MRTRRLGKAFSGGNEKRRDVATESLSIQLFMDRPSTVRARFIVSSFFQVAKMTVLSVYRVCEAKYAVWPSISFRSLFS